MNGNENVHFMLLSKSTVKMNVAPYARWMGGKRFILLIVYVELNCLSGDVLHLEFETDFGNFKI